MVQSQLAIAAGICLLCATAAWAQRDVVAGQSPRVEFGALATSGKVNRAWPVEGHGLCAGMPDGKERYLCAVQRPSGETAWRLGDDRGERLLDGSDAGESVADFELDRSWRYLAVVTAAEGHPFLAVYDLGQWQASGKRPEPLLAVNPYPGTLQLDGWDDNMHLPAAKGDKHCVYFSSDGPVSGETGDFPLPQARPFRSCFPEGHIERL